MANCNKLQVKVVANAIIAVLFFYFLGGSFELVEGIPLEQFYPFGNSVGDTALPKIADTTSSQIQLTISAFPYFGVDHVYLYINANGDITFNGPFSTYRPRSFPTSVPMIAPFWADSDTSPADGGDIWYRETSDPNLLDRARNTIQAVCIDHTSFDPVSLFITTWDHVGQYRRITHVTNTFQCVLATDGTSSFVIFLYADGLIQWLWSSWHTGIAAQVGINAGDGVQFFSHPDALTNDDRLMNITQSSNIDTPGVWLFRVDGEGQIFRGCNVTSNAVVSLKGVASPPNEGDGKGIAAQLTLTINNLTATFNNSEFVEVSVYVAVVTGVGETAIEGTDFTLDTGEFNFTLNATELMSSGNDSTIILTNDVMVTTLEDSLVEGTESYVLSIAVVSGPGIQAIRNTVTVSITDNEAATVNIEGVPSSPGEGDESGPVARLRLELDPPTATLSENVTVSVAPMSGGTITAIEGSDYNLDVTEFTFTARLSEESSLVDVLVTPSDDVFVEGTEVFVLSISILSGPASIGTMDMVTVNFADNEVAAVSIEGVESPPGEDDGVGIAAYLRLSIEPSTSILGIPVTVQVAVRTGLISTASEGADYSLDTTTVNFPLNSVNDATTAVVVTPVDDILIEGTETYVLSIQVVSGPASIDGGLVILEIVDNDVSDGDNKQYLDFLDVTAFDNMRELPREEDSFSDPIYIPKPGFLYGNRVVGTAYVNENGVISFNAPWKYSYPELFPTSNYKIRTEGLAVAPFWSDVDIRKSGTIRYATFLATEASSQNETQCQELERVNAYVNSNLPDDGTNSSFSGTWMLVAHWDDVHSSPHGADNPSSNKGLDRTNNFQGVIVTNVSHTFAIFNYICGELQWSGILRDNQAVVGYIASSDIFSNHPSSGFLAINHAVSCSGGHVRGNSLIQVIGIGDDDIQRRLDSCLRKQPSDVVIEGAFPNEIKFFLSQLEPCPPTETLARTDVGRFLPFETSYNPNCYVTGRPLTIPLPQLSQFTITQQCCYVAGGLVNEGPMAGAMLLYHPIIDEVNYLIHDEAFRLKCCTLEFPNLCENYFERRPSNDGSTYESPIVASGTGDPHFRTFDGRYYDFQGLGEFHSVNALGEDGGILFSLQGRQDVLYSNNRVTWHTAVAFGQPDVIAYELASPNFVVYQTVPTHSQHEITHELVNGVPRYDDQTKSVLIRNGNRLTAAFFESGVVLETNGWGASISWTVRVPRRFHGRTEGILGLYDGDKSNDFKLRNGTILAQTISERKLYDYYIDSWRVNDADRMFFTGFENRRRRQALNDSESMFEPIFFSDLDFSDDQILVCEGNAQCLFDLAITNDTEIGMQVLEDEKEANATIDLLENITPNISAIGTFRVNIGEEAVYTIEVIDPGDNVTFTVQGGEPINSYLEELEDGQYTFRWSLQDLTNDPLIFVATDTRNASTTHTPTVEVCACANDGVCTVDGLLTTNTTIIMACLCGEAFSGQFCEEDRDGCGEIQCYERVECLDVPAPGTGAVCGACPLGFTGDGLKCYDIDECELNETECEQLCINAEGSFQCDCTDGYQLVGSTQCEDLDECTENLHDCEQVCENTVGSYNCSCEPGFTFDGENCTANQLCANNNGCSHTCAVVDGVARCFCPLGLQLPTSGSFQCIDIDECLNSTCNQSCVNSFGSFKCACNDGYSLLSDGRNCEDIDECLEAALDAVELCENDQNTQCSNTEGAFKCVCVPGFERQNGTCQVIEEEPPPPPPPVATPPNGLESSVSFLSPTLNISDFTPQKQQQFREVTANAVVLLCMNTTCAVITTDGDTEERYNLQPKAQNVAIPTGIINQLDSGEVNITFYVQFSDGSILNVENLTTAVEVSVEEYRYAGFLPDINECATNNGGCEQVCVNIIGSFYCDCDDGFTLNVNGTTCDDIDECATNNGGCEQTCINTVGSFNCSCNDGFLLYSDGATCNDVNECSPNNGGCEQVCTNTIGSFNCSCDNGFSPNADGSTCDDIDECVKNSDNCDHICTNTVGSFNCSCSNGYSLNADGSTCDDIDECSINNGGCEQVCINTFGSYNCSCDDGFFLIDNGKTCEDINECVSSGDNCEQVCTNNVGSFNCSCNNGFILNADGASCDDIDECFSNNGGCEQNCSNTVGSFNCSCFDGYSLNANGVACDDIDECAIDTDDCDQVCINTVGSFNCSCYDGFSFNAENTTCDDIDECSISNGGCDQFCNNTVGSFNCSCYHGFSLNANGSTCDDIDECATNGSDCEQICMNMVGSFNCSCDAGYLLNADGATCDDIDECLINNGGCDQICTNTVGSFNCSCDSGFTLNADGATCSDVHECLTNNGGCEQVCINTVGSFNCSCVNGFSLNANGRNCDDIDECATNSDNCEQVCINTVGSFNCSCYDGFSLRTDEAFCDDIDECSFENGGCDQVCINTIGSFNCSCNGGFSLNTDGMTCDDIDECLSSNGGCDQVCTNAVGSFNCSCGIGFNLNSDGATCDDINECSSNNGGCDHVCINTVGSFYCTCNDGHSLHSNGANCDDINECISDNGGCEQVCTNTVGSFNCSCNDGYLLNADGATCDDIDECTSNSDNCEQVCINTVGSFNCSCYDGFFLRNDGATCHDINECSSNNGGCDHVCINTVGSFNCSCNDGHSLHSNGANCDDINECLSDRHNCEHVCINTVGSFNCSCNDGYLLNADGETCDDIDECSTNGDNCEQVCINTVGSFNCSCDDGFFLNENGATCDDINECSLNNGGCDHVCINTVGSFNCSCNDGHSLHSNGANCDDINECFSDNGGCEQVCINTVGSFNCSCNDGYLLNADGASCDDIDECTRNTDNCEQVCINTVGSFNCTCNDGYLLNTDKAACDDIDECLSDIDDCEQVCTNTIGSFDCSCNNGFILNGNGKTCDDIDECSFDNGGCEQVCTNTVGSFSCSCNDGFSLHSNGAACIDIDECATNGDNCEQVCTNTVGSFNCSCTDGYVLSTNRATCDDTNECFTDNGGCQHNCTNTIGSFSCSCNDGFILNVDGAACDDVDECATNGNNDCEHACTNTIGSYVCSCHNGFSLNTDGSTCNDINECSTDNGGCEQICTNAIGSFNCSCYNGFSLHSDGAACSDINECFSDNGGCEHVCINTIGSFNCSCNDGYLLNADGASCDDIDECTKNTDNCEQVCTNAVGSFNCSCDNGFSLNANRATCDDIDECSTDNGGCEQICVNIIGSFGCSCNNGYFLNANGVNCNDDNECSSDNGGCEQVCTNTVGSFNCSCIDGFSLNINGTTCDDIDECSSDNGGCEQVCTSTVGSFICSCIDGFSLNINGTTCDDIDECATSNGNCDQVCSNSIGSFNCSCDSGFILNADKSTCDDVDECYLDMGGCDQVCTNTVGSFNCSCNEGFILSADWKTCDETQLLPKIEQQAGLLVSLNEYNIQTFSVEVQRHFKITTAMALNTYCVSNPQECETQPIPTRKRQSDLFTEEDVVIANIIELEENDIIYGVQFELYILLEEDLSILSRDIVQLVVQDNIDLYHSAGFTGVSVKFLVVNGLSTVKVVGIVIGCLAVVLFMLGIMIGLSCVLWFRCTKSLDVNKVPRELPRDFINPNFKVVSFMNSKEEDTASVQWVSITFNDEHGSHTEPPVALEPEKEDITSL